ncbi:hypothetical protein F5Y13DRAFT_204148 [Hypoxylon sp. FL1857]|nr:hypothetical protein F5Y13DRAFT_204148 [Hypoxylon sp. FL1857]
MSTSSFALTYPPGTLPIHCPRSDGKVFEESRFPPTHEIAPPDADKPWLAKLGEMLGDQLYPNSGRHFVLEAFPEHYHLRVRHRNNGARHDYYLYGYPDAEEDDRRKKKLAPKYYRSPADFLDHLLWLAVDREMDRNNCFCRNCKPSTEAHEDAVNAAVPTQARPGPPGSYPTAHPTAHPAAPPAAPGGGTAAPSTAATSRPATFTVITQPDESALFREGEVVWFRNLQQAFRLGIILRNFPGDPTTQAMSKSIIKPLSHSRSSIDEIERSDVEMRPFLTFSVPPVNAALQAIVDQPMASVQWDVLEATLPYEENTRAQVLSLEASKVAACHIDHSYSLFNPLHNPIAPPNQQSFGGVFFGCEKLGIFEAARVRVEDHEYTKDKDVEYTFAMIIKNIILERFDQGKAERLLFQGDIWLLQESTAPHHAPNQDQLPPAMRREKAFRDSVARVRGVHFDWVPVLANVTKTEDAIRGRFYESQKLGPILYQAEWDPSLQQGVIPSIEMRLNNRLDSLGSYIGRKNSRLDTIAGAVPPDTVLSLGPRVIEWP